MSPDIAAANLAAHWAATARTGRRQRGRAWYPTARAWAEGLAEETGHTLAQVVAVLAITSPGAQLVSNVRWTESIMRGGYWRPTEDGDEWVAVDTGGRFPNANRPKIAAVLANPEAAAAYVTGPKVGPFHHAIMGDTSALVLDRWAIFAATGERGDDHLSKVAGTKRREAVDTAYRALARKVGMSVRDLQAVIWLHVRETTAHGKTGTVHQLADFTLGMAA